jgi:hypothetical protein
MSEQYYQITNSLTNKNENDFLTNCIYLDTSRLSEFYNKMYYKTNNFNKLIKIPEKNDYLKNNKNCICHSYKYNFKFKNDNSDLDKEWFDAYNFDSPKKNTNQSIILQAWQKGLLDMLDPNMVYDETLEKIWFTINKYELWIENIDEKYWTKLENYINYEYKYLKF